MARSRRCRCLSWGLGATGAKKGLRVRVCSFCAWLNLYMYVHIYIYIYILCMAQSIYFELGKAILGNPTPGLGTSEGKMAPAGKWTSLAVQGLGL